eukprot:TRINITY_DN2008_c0_g1_i1.p1 TRINITY_DN2008_c0_g1~~TRINITY_DN2008_c0_g1_i1.p1  ORF type:complete len:142 (-),score=31.56 TRINITY_DN2008_c0_g1_i1:22-447(-)
MLAKPTSDTGANPFSDSSSGGGYSAQVVDQKLEEEVRIQDALIQERDIEIRKIQSQMQELNEIFKDLATIVLEQGEMVDNIGLNIRSAGKNITKGNKNLDDALRSSTSFKKKMCYVAILITILAGLGVIVVFLFSLGDKAQ